MKKMMLVLLSGATLFSMGSCLSDASTIGVWVGGIQTFADLAGQILAALPAA